MSTTGAKYPTLGESASEAPWSDDAWTNPTNIYSDNGAVASVTAATYDAGDQTTVLKATGFDFSAIPDGSTILGIICKVNAWYSAGSANMDLCQLLDTSKAKVGTNQCSTPVTMSPTDTTVITKGANNDLWGNALSAAWVKNANFGVALGCIATAANTDVNIDYVTLEVYYTPPPVAVGQDTETDVVQIVSAARVKPVAQQSSTDQVQTIATVKQNILAQLLETDMQWVLGKTKIRSISLVTEIDIQQIIEARIVKFVTVALVTEVEAIFAIEIVRSVSLAQIVEADSVQTITVQRIVPITLVTEVELDLVSNIAKMRSIASVSEVDLIWTVTLTKQFNISQVYETETTWAPGVVKMIPISEAQDIETSQMLTRKITESGLAIVAIIYRMRRSIFS